MLQPCSKLPDLISPQDNYDCLVDITKRYVITYVLDSGKYGVVIKTSVATDNTQVYAVKIAGLDENAVADITVACQINSLHIETGVFLRTFGWITCVGVPKPWKTHYISDYPELLSNAIKRNDTLLYIFMDLADEGWDNPNRVIKFTFDEIFAMFYLLLHGLYVARKRLGAFAHQDIHPGNIMLQTTRLDSEIDVLQHKITGLRFVPKFIDYGRSTTDVVETTDVYELMFTLAGKIYPRKVRHDFEAQLDNMSEFKTASKSMSDNSDCILYLLEALDVSNNPHFTQGGAIIQQCCTQCGASANLMWENTDVAFCGSHCAEQKSAIGALLI